MGTTIVSVSVAFFVHFHLNSKLPPCEEGPHPKMGLQSSMCMALLVEISSEWNKRLKPWTGSVLKQSSFVQLF